MSSGPLKPVISDALIVAPEVEYLPIEFVPKLTT